MQSKPGKLPENYREGPFRRGQSLNLKQRLWDVAGEGSSRRITEVDEFVPVRCFALLCHGARLVWIDGWRQSDRYAGRARKVCAIAQELASAGQRHRNYRHAG